MKSSSIALNSCPIFAKRKDIYYFAGSAFFFRHKNEILLCTADHVIASHPGSKFSVVLNNGPISAKVIKRDENLDLCILRSTSLPKGDVGLTISNNVEKPGNIQLYVYEFSTTEIVDDKYSINAATRIGNCVRLIQREDVFSKAGRNMLELSFPALRGASGSAVIEIRPDQMIVHGILVANTEHHLLPAHIETVLDEKNDILEERKYFLPQGAAVNSIHLLNMLEDI